MDAIGEFINDCKKFSELYKHKGVVRLEVYTDSAKSEKRVSIWIDLRDSFKDDPPQQYAHLWGTIVLIKQFENESSATKNEVSPEQLEALLNEVGDRVFVAQKRSGRWVETYNTDGSLKRRSFQKIISMGSGSPAGIVLMIDKKTGKVRKLKPV